jgi:hypothetical protein
VRYLINKENFFGNTLRIPQQCTDILAVLEFSNFKNVYSINDSIVYVRVSDKSISESLKLEGLKSQEAI